MLKSQTLIPDPSLQRNEEELLQPYWEELAAWYIRLGIQYPHTRRGEVRWTVNQWAKYKGGIVLVGLPDILNQNLFATVRAVGLKEEH